MAKFKYRMQNILDIKTKLETQAQNEYGIANRKYLEEQAALQELMIRRVEYEKSLKELVEGMLDIKSINNARNDVNNIKTLVRRQMMEVHKAEIVLEKTRNELNEKMKERKTHEKLKEHALDEFKADLQMAETKEIDELVSYTFNGK
ncbi:MAG: flagellar export protein FliJ [Agathobacter sp.]|nr:flagellar export protein FliJ [Agathobacter sp.]